MSNSYITGAKACMEANRPVNEEPYEVNMDNHGCCDGPKNGRLRASTNVRIMILLKNILLVIDAFSSCYKYFIVNHICPWTPPTM